MIEITICKLQIAVIEDLLLRLKLILEESVENVDKLQLTIATFKSDIL